MGRDEQEAEAVLEEAVLGLRWRRYFCAFWYGRSVPSNPQSEIADATGGPKGDGCSAGLGGGIISRITTLFGTAVEAARSSEGIFTSFSLVLFLFSCGEVAC